jgi:hypothetical protein
MADQHHQKNRRQVNLKHALGLYEALLRLGLQANP